MYVASWCCTRFCVVLCISFCTGHFVMVPLNLTYLHCLKHSLFKHLFNLYFNRQDPEYLNNILTLYSLRRQLRSADDNTLLVAPRTRTITYGERCFTTAAPKLWNTLPRTLRKSQSLTCVKIALKTHLFCNTYTS